MPKSYGVVINKFDAFGCPLGMLGASFKSRETKLRPISWKDGEKQAGRLYEWYDWWIRQIFKHDPNFVFSTAPTDGLARMTTI